MDWQNVLIPPATHNPIAPVRPAHRGFRVPRNGNYTMRTIDIDNMTSAYVECALWSSVHFESDDGCGTPFDQVDAELSAATKAAMRAGCGDFLSYLESEEIDVPEEAMSCEQIGHDFWLTRNGHGAGFWDRGIGELGDKLTEAARTFGSSDLYLGDDGMIHCQ